MKMNKLAKRYHRFWISDEETGKRERFMLFWHLPVTFSRLWVDHNELMTYHDKLPEKHFFFVQEFDEECERGHTYRQIMGLEALDCDCKPDEII